MAVLRPLKVVIENYPEGQSEELDAVNHPDDPAAGLAPVRFGREIYVERDDFMENPPKKFFRLSPGAGGAPALRLFRHLPRGGEGRRRRGGRAALHLRPGDARRQHAARRPQGEGDAALGRRRPMRSPPRCGSSIRLFTRPDPRTRRTFAADLNPNSLEVLTDCRLEPAIVAAEAATAGPVRAAGLFRPRSGLDAASRCRSVFNRTVGLRDTFAKTLAGAEGWPRHGA